MARLQAQDDDMVDNEPVLIKVSTSKLIPIKPEMIAGRLADCDLKLVEGHASRKHAKLVNTDGTVWIEDLQSANGTFVNGVRITGRQKLNSGDRIRFDVEEFDFRGPTVAAGDDGKTLFRPADLAAVDALSSGVKKRPGAWANMDASRGEANKTQFIEPAALKEMMNKGVPAAEVRAAPKIDVPHLQVVSGSQSGINVRLTVGQSGLREWTIGSDPVREVRLYDSGVSGLHARIINEGERWKVLDQMSANGTFINGKRSNVSYLSSGDRLRFGPVECLFFASTQGAAQSARGEKSEEKSKTVVIAAVAFAATLAILFIVYKFVM